MTSEQVAVYPRDFDFRAVALRDFLYHPLRLTSVYLFGLLSALFFLATVFPAGLELTLTSTAMVLYLGYSLIYLGRLGSTLDDVKRGKEWLCINNQPAMLRRYAQKKPSLQGLEAKFATVAYENRITSFEINNGRLFTQGKVEIEVRWFASDTLNATLYLYSDTGDMQDDVTKLKRRPSAKCLSVQRGERPIEYVQTGVKSDDNYNYYAWIEVDFYGRLILSDLHHGHWTRRRESPTEYADRSEQNERAFRRVKALRAPPVPAPENPLGLFARVVSRIEQRLREPNAEDEDTIIEEECAKENLDMTVAEEIKERLLRRRYPH